MTPAAEGEAMPTERFEKLAPEKKERIRQAAISEFSRTDFENASINRIIQDADISRGSFYTYFADKMDLLRYIMMGYKTELQSTLIRFLDEENGDPFKMADRMYRKICQWYKNDKQSRIVQTFWSSMHVFAKAMEVDETDRSVYSSRRFRMFCETLYEHTDHIHFQISKEEFVPFTEMILTTTLRDAIHSSVKPESRKTIRQAMNMQMNFIRNGVYHR